jgi:hypothetical protein
LCSEGPSKGKHNPLFNYEIPCLWGDVTLFRSRIMFSRTNINYRIFLTFSMPSMLLWIEYWRVGGCCFGNHDAQDFDLKIDLHSVDVDDVAPPTVKLSNAKRHESLLSNFLLNNSSHFGVNEISFQKLVRNLNKMTIANLGRPHHKSLDSYF